MFNANRPARSDLPSTAQLLKSTGIAAVVASVLVVTVVMPAEYGVDPTRVGSLLGLTEMGRIKVQLAAEAEADAAADAAGAADLVEPGALTILGPELLVDLVGLFDLFHGCGDIAQFAQELS